MTHADAAKPLRLFALDFDDLAVVSAHLQDAQIAVSDLAYLPGEGRFALAGLRFDWLKAASGGCERCAVGLHFERVTGVSFTGFARTDEGRVLNLLAIEFQPKDPPSGLVVLTFSAGAAIQLVVEYIEAQMRDLGPRWPCGEPPAHPTDA